MEDSNTACICWPSTAVYLLTPLENGNKGQLHATRRTWSRRQQNPTAVVQRFIFRSLREEPSLHWLNPEGYKQVEECLGRTRRGIGALLHPGPMAHGEVLLQLVVDNVKLVVELVVELVLELVVELLVVVISSSSKNDEEQ